MYSKLTLDFIHCLLFQKKNGWGVLGLRIRSRNDSPVFSQFLVLLSGT